MDPSPIPAKEKSSSVPSVDSKERKRLGVRKKPFKAFVEIRTIFCYYVRMEV